MSDSLLTEEDKKLLEEKIASLKKEVKTSLGDEEKELLEKVIKSKVEEELRKRLEEEEEKKRQAELAAKEKATQEAYLAKIKELEERLNKLQGNDDGGSSKGSAAPNPFDDPSPKDINDYSYDELAEIDAASMKVFFEKRQGLSLNPQ